MEFGQLSVFAKNAMGQVCGRKPALQFLELLEQFGVPQAKELPVQEVEGESYRFWQNEHFQVFLRDPQTSRYPGASLKSLTQTGRDVLYALHKLLLKAGLYPDVKEANETHFGDQYVLRGEKIYRYKREYRVNEVALESLLSKDEFCDFLLAKLQRKYFDTWDIGHIPEAVINGSLWFYKIPMERRYEENSEENIIEVVESIKVREIKDYRWDDPEPEHSSCQWLQYFLWRNRRHQSDILRVFNHEEFEELIETVRNR